MNRHLRFLLICLPFTAALVLADVPKPLMDHVIAAANSYGPVYMAAVLGNPWVQLALCLPVYITGMYFFGTSALKSIRKGRPNMNVLIAIGATAAFVYSLTGTLLDLGPAYLFYETAAAVITLVFLGYYLEDISVRSTQRALDGLVREEKVMANMVAYDDQQQEMVFPVESDQLRSGDLILIRSGERVPADAKILWGDASVDETILTGESLPLEKKVKDFLVGGSVLVSGTVRAQVTADAGDSVLAGIVGMVRQAQKEKPPMQQLADRISAVFIPAVLGLAILTLLLNILFLHAFAPALMRAIAVLVIACPCAMGLATPTAIAVGLGRAARLGILFRRAAGLEAFTGIRQVVFDKTGTLTTGEFSIVRWEVVPVTGSGEWGGSRGAERAGSGSGENVSASCAGERAGLGSGESVASGSGVVPGGWDGGAIGQPAAAGDGENVNASGAGGSGEAAAAGSGESGSAGDAGGGVSDAEFRRIAFSLEKYSSHPLARSIVRQWRQKNDIRWARIEEIKGLGMRGETRTGEVYEAGSYKIAAELTTEDQHTIYIVRNGILLGWIDLEDTVRPEAAGVLERLRSKGFRIILLSGDRKEPCQRLADALGIGEVYAEQTPAQKLEKVAQLSAVSPTALVGDGVNDAPALAKATVGISMGDASQLALQTADVVLMNQGLRRLPAALELGRCTFDTIRQNLFWAFLYNIVAIPVAALGLLSPAVAALVMGFSDVVLAANSLRLFLKKAA